MASKYYKSEAWRLVQVGKLHKLPGNTQKRSISQRRTDDMVDIYATHTGDATSIIEATQLGRDSYVVVQYLPQKDRYQLSRIYTDYSGIAPYCWGVPSDDNTFRLNEIQEHLQLLISTIPTSHIIKKAA